MKANMEIVTSTSMIVPEVLKEDNYKRWSILMKQYLVAQDLWDVVQSSRMPGERNTSELMKKNALALHAIGISCGREAFDQIKNLDSAKGAWDALKRRSIVQDVTSPSMIVPEVLKEDNYERWSILMKHYLVAQDFWDVVQSGRIPKKGNTSELMEKNALALHVIGISCGREAFDQIKNLDSAKGAWDALKRRSIVQGVAPDPSKPHQERQTETLQNLVFHDSISEVKRFLGDDSQMLYSALKHAISCGRRKMAHYLYRKIPDNFLQGDSGFFFLEHCITKSAFDIALDLLLHSPELAFSCPSNSAPLISTLAETVPPFLSLRELGPWGRWIYKSTRVKVFPIKPRSALAVCVDIVKVRVLYKFHLVCVMIGLLCWTPCWLPAVRMYESSTLFVFELLLLFAVPLLKPDLLYVLIGVHLFGLLVPAGKTGQSLMLFPVFILLLVIQRLILRKLDKELSRKPEQHCMLRIAAELLRMPIGVPLMSLGVPILLTVSGKRLLLPTGVPILVTVSTKRLVLPRVIFFPLFLLFSMPLLIHVIQKYKLKLMDEYALEVIRFICGSLSKLDENEFKKSGAVDASYLAIENDIPEIVIELLKKRKGKILWSHTDPERSRNMFAHAVTHRQEKVACFLYDEFCKCKDINMVTATEEDGNNILHIAARLAPDSQLDKISGAALQLQSELHWFKSVEGIVPHFSKEKNKDGETPTQVFLKEHKKLVEDAKGWMKTVAESCTVVGALVITIMFAVAFTVPGGNDENNGFPTFLKNGTDSSSTTSFVVVPFMVFTVSDAISLFTASSSVLMFLGILTSRYTYQDFHTSLPVQLLIGLSLLFISIAAMMAAFCASLLMMLHYKWTIVTPIILLASIPVTLFILLQSSLLIEIYESTLRPDIFNRRRYWKYGKNADSCFNRRRWFRMRRRWTVWMLCALLFLYLISFSLFVILRVISRLIGYMTL